MKEEEFESQINFIEEHLPLDIPLYDASQSFPVPGHPQQRYMIRRKVITLISKTGYCSDGRQSWHIFATNDNGMELEIEAFLYGRVEEDRFEFIQHFFDDRVYHPPKYVVPLKTVYQLARTTIKPVAWLFKIPAFWKHPLCERQLVSVINKF